MAKRKEIDEAYDALAELAAALSDEAGVKDEGLTLEDLKKEIDAAIDEVKEEEHDKDSLLNEFGEVNLPKVINKVRDFVNSLSDVSNLIETSEVDLTDKYQIVIEIDKNTPM